MAQPPLCAHSAWPLTLFSIVSSLFPSLPRAQILESLPSSPTPALEAVAAEVELDAPKKKKKNLGSPQCRPSGSQLCYGFVYIPSTWPSAWHIGDAQ